MFVRIVLVAALVLLTVPLFAGVIDGRVTNAATGEGVSGVTVRFQDRQNHSFTTVTTIGGAYVLAGLPDGEYQGEFSREGFADNRRSMTFTDLLSGSRFV